MPKRIILWVDRVSRWVYLAVAIVTAVVMILLYIENRQNREALCDFRADLDLRIAFSQKLLDDNPKAKVIQGFSRDLIEMSLINSKRTRKTLNNLNCTSLF